jgi:limonene-1,2-epoxide hydrolase
MDAKSAEANIAAVRLICEQWPWLTREDFHALLAPDCDYRNVPIAGDRHIGPDAAYEVLSRTSQRWDVRLEVLNIVGDGERVLTERLEHFTHKKGARPGCDLPVMGAFEVKDGKITAWRDYFEMTHASALMGPPPSADG